MRTWTGLGAASLTLTLACGGGGGGSSGTGETATGTGTSASTGGTQPGTGTDPTSTTGTSEGTGTTTEDPTTAGPTTDATTGDVGPDPLAPERRIDWDPGVRGGIPGRGKTCATLAPGATAGEIQAALDACEDGAVVLEAGEFSLDARLEIPGGVTLRGAGIGATRVVGVPGFGDNALVVIDSGFDSEWTEPARDFDLASMVKGADTVTTTAPHGWSAGDVILIDMLEQPAGDPPIDHAGSLGDCGWCGRETGVRPIGQWVRVVDAPSATEVKIDPPLYWGYANAPQGVRMTGLTERAGLEDLTLDNLASEAQDTVALFGAVDSWLLRVALIGSKRRALWAYGALWLTVQGCRITGGIPIGADFDPQYESNSAYGIFLGPHVTASLFTDNILDRLTNAIAWEGNAAGNVYSYNLSNDMWWFDTGDHPRRFGPLMHGPHPFMNLLEGNWSGGRFRADEYWGTSSHFVLLRNRIVQVDRGPDWSQSWTIDVERRNWYYSLLGNLLGVDGVEDRYELSGEDFPYSLGPVAVYRLGYCALCTNPNLHDPMVRSTLVRHGNWVSRLADDGPGAGVEWEPDIASHFIPSSYYLTSKPDWFGALAWPPFDPEAPDAADPRRIPAGERYCQLVPGAAICSP